MTRIISQYTAKRCHVDVCISFSSNPGQTDAMFSIVSTCFPMCYILGLRYSLLCQSWLITFFVQCKHYNRLSLWFRPSRFRYWCVSLSIFLKSFQASNARMLIARRGLQRVKLREQTGYSEHWRKDKKWTGFNTTVNGDWYFVLIVENCSFQESN